jgi:hypothetical protein
VVASADVNGDGKVELISANWGNGSGNSLTVLTNNGNGGFGSNATCTVGVGPSFVTAADINGDGKLDLINANIGYFNGNTLTVLTNNANGGFGSSATYAVGNNPTEVIAADVNGDGKLDLISADSGVGVNTLMVLTNNGSGVFGSNATYTVNRPVWIASADINGDGKVDLICANYSALHKYLHNRQTASAAYWVSFNSKNDKTRSISRWIESKVALATRFICSLDSINNFPNLAFK